MAAKKKLYVWYSAATDVTGSKIKEELGADGGTKKPVGTYETVLCWGAKTSEPVQMANNTVFNHPNKIRTNRNKLEALKAMKAAGCNVADFDTNYKNLVKANGWPLVGRTKFHQGGAGFWICLNAQMAEQALSEEAQYFQDFIDIKDEYRLHVVGDEVVYAVKKKPRNNHKDAFKAHWGDHVKNFAEKKGQNLDQATLDMVLDRFARKMSGQVDMITRSNTRGWTFSRVNNPPKAMADEAVKAVKALGLDFGAVDCCIDVDGKAWIIECNTGPGLEGSSFTAVTAALNKLTKPAPAKKAPAKKAVAAKAAGKAVAKGGNEKKVKLQGKMQLMQEMLEAADSDEELAVVEGLWAKMGAK